VVLADDPVISPLPKGVRVSGLERKQLAAELKKEYDAGASIDALVVVTGRSYGFVHRLLNEARTKLRGRGGAGRYKAEPSR
jgi:translation initiation factor 1 (eIF-1/SUI1)